MIGAQARVEVMNDVLSKRQLPPLSAESYAAAFRFPVREYYRELGFDFAREKNVEAAWRRGTARVWRRLLR